MEPQMDNEAVNLTKAIRQTETGGKFDAKGKSGEYGAYQWMPNTWKAHAKEVLGNENAEMTPQNQNAVAYSVVKKWKDSGLNAAQIAAKWNSGSEIGWENKVGTNKFGAHYDVPKYVKSVTDAYQQLKGGAQVGVDPNNPSSTANPQNKEGFISSVFRDITSPVATLLARPVQLGAELLGASPEQVNEASSKVPFYGKGGALDVPQTGKDVVKDVGRGLETVSLGLPARGLADAARMGAVAGAGSGLEKDASLSSAATGGAIGAGVGLAGGLVAKALEKLPSWLTKDAFSNMTPEQAEHTLKTKTAGSMESLLKQSKDQIGKFGTQIDGILKNAPEKGGGDFAVRATTTQFPEFAGKEAKMLAKIKSLIPAGYDMGLQGEGWDRASILKLVDKIADGTATLWEKNRVRSAIDSATSGGYNRLARSLNPSAGHDLAMTFAGALRNEVQQSAPETIPIFEEFAKEMGVQKALGKLAQKKSGGLIKWSDLVPFLGGSSLGGPIGGLVGIAANRFANSPTTEFGVARGLLKTSKVANPVLNRAGLLSQKK